MKHTIIPIVALALLAVSCSNNNQPKLDFTDPTVGEYDSLNIVDTNDAGGPSTVIYYSGNSDIFRQYYSDHSLRAEGTVTNGLREGRWVFYFPDGNIQAEGNYVGGKEASIARTAPPTISASIPWACAPASGRFTTRTATLSPPKTSEPQTLNS